MQLEIDFCIPGSDLALHFFIVCHSLTCFHLIKEWLLENLLTS